MVIATDIAYMVFYKIETVLCRLVHILYLGEISWTPHNRSHFFAVALECHGWMLRIRNLEGKHFNSNEGTTQILLIKQNTECTFQIYV